MINHDNTSIHSSLGVVKSITKGSKMKQQDDDKKEIYQYKKKPEDMIGVVTMIVSTFNIGFNAGKEDFLGGLEFNPARLKNTSTYLGYKVGWITTRDEKESEDG